MRVLDLHNPITQGLVIDLPFTEGGGTTTFGLGKLHQNGTISSATWAKTLYGNTLSFNGVSSKVTFSGTTFTAGQPFALMALIMTTPSTNTYVIGGVREGDPTQTGKMTQMRITSGKVQFNHDFLADTTNNKADSTSRVDDGRYHQIICQYNGSVLSIYIDGVADGTSGTRTGLVLNSTNSWTVGTRNDFSAEWFPGEINLFRVWKGRTLTSAEIKKLAENPWCIYRKPPYQQLGKSPVVITGSPQNWPILRGSKFWGPRF